MTLATYPHKSAGGLIEPVAQIKHNVAILFADTWMYRRVTRLQAIPPFQFLNLGALAAQAVAPKTNAGNLDLKDDEFGQFRWFPVDNAQVRLWLPPSTQDYSLRNIASVLDPTIATRDPCLHLTEFFLWEDERPQFDATNPADYALAQCRLVAMGFRFLTEPLEAATIDLIKSGREPCVYVMAQSLA